MTSRIDPRSLTRELLRYNTINPPGMERACARHLGALLEAAGFAVKYHEFAESRTSLVAEIGGDDDRAPICFTGHIDVVPLGAAPWSHDAFAGETDGDKLLGRVDDIIVHTTERLGDGNVFDEQDQDGGGNVACDCAEHLSVDTRSAGMLEACRD